MHVGAPRDGARLKEILRQCVEIENAPSMLRFPKGAIPADIPAVERESGVDILHRGASQKVLLISIGSMASMALEVAQLAKQQSIEITVVDPLWVKPISSAIIAMCEDYDTVVVMEDGIKTLEQVSASVKRRSNLCNMIKDERLSLAWGEADPFLGLRQSTSFGIRHRVATFNNFHTRQTRSREPLSLFACSGWFARHKQKGQG